MPKKFALLVGCNYSNHPEELKGKRLHGCINDVNAMQTLIRQRFGFEDQNITILTDNTNKKPTFSDIKLALEHKVEATKPGDTLLFYFSGGGARVPSGNKNETISVIVPSDLKPITGAHILPIIARLPGKAIFTFICDSSYSGGLFRQNDPINSNVVVNVQNFRSKTIPPTSLPLENHVKVHPFNNGILLTSSRSNEESVEVYPNGDKSKAFSVYSSAIQALFNSPKAVKPPAGKTNSNVQEFIQSSLKFAQHPVPVNSPNNAANKAVALFLPGQLCGVDAAMWRSG